MARVNLNFEISQLEAFNMLCQALHVELKDNIDESNFVIEDDEIAVKDYDDRGELYMALYHLATKICGNTEFRSIFDDPNILMSKLYKKKEEPKKERLFTKEEILDMIHTSGIDELAESYMEERLEKEINNA